MSPEQQRRKWPTLLLLALAELLAISVWFSASAVIPPLTEAWDLTAGGQAWLTMSVQIGFVVGALASAIFNLADRIPARLFITGSAISAGILTALVPLLADGLPMALLLRFITGIVLAGVYPVGMKIMSTWTKQDRGLAIGLLVGALTVGSASPHLLNVFGGTTQWQLVMYLSAICAILGGLISFFFIDEGPYRTKTPPFNWRYVGQILQQRDVLLANLGYLGHMWELYAMWSWIAAFLLASFTLSGLAPAWASGAAFAVIAMGGLGSLLGGKWADKYGRTTLTTISMIISSICALTVGFLFGGNPVLLVAVCLIWGFTIVADSAQFSAAVSELSPKAYVGTALTLQTSLGFLLTLFTIRLIPPIEALIGWRYAFAFLALGPVVGIWAMLTLRQAPTAIKLASGKR